VLGSTFFSEAYTFFTWFLHAWLDTAGAGVEVGVGAGAGEDERVGADARGLRSRSGSLSDEA